jgi:hypothetical protein
VERATASKGYGVKGLSGKGLSVKGLSVRAQRNEQGALSKRQLDGALGGPDASMVITTVLC